MSNKLFDFVPKADESFICKDLANIVSYQQDQVDEVEGTMEQANKSAESGLKQIEKAHKKSVEGNCIVS